MSTVIKTYRGFDILRKYLGETRVRAEHGIIYVGEERSASTLSLTEVELAMLADAGWIIDPTQLCWAIQC